jgi:hypothetical protein
MLAEPDVLVGIGYDGPPVGLANEWEIELAGDRRPVEPSLEHEASGPVLRFRQVRAIDVTVFEDDWLRLLCNGKSISEREVRQRFDPPRTVSLEWVIPVRDAHL